MKRTFSCFVAILAVSQGVARSEGMIQFRNTIASRVLIDADGSGPGGAVPPGTALNYGVFVISSNPVPTLILPVGTPSPTQSGLINAPSPFAIPGTTNGQTVRLQIMGWSASFGTNWCLSASLAGEFFGRTDVRQVTLGDTNNPTIIWQSSTGINADRFHPLVINGGPLSPYYRIGMNDIVASEGNSGWSTAEFTLSRREVSGSTNSRTVAFATRDGTAIAGQDYIATNGTVHFAPGQTSAPIRIALISDTDREEDEVFSVEVHDLSCLRVFGELTGTCMITEARLVEARPDGADVVVTIHTITGRRYALEVSADLSTWIIVEGAGDITGVGGPMTVRHSGAGLGGQQFYRTRLLTL